MPHFSALSLRQLQSCHVDLQTLFNEVIKHRDCKVVEGYRGKAAQEAAYAAGNSKLHYPYSKHNSTPSNAVDVLPYPVNWNKRERIVYFAGFVEGLAEMLFLQGKISHKIRWGGDFDGNLDPTNQSFFDGAHFELI